MRTQIIALLSLLTLSSTMAKQSFEYDQAMIEKAVEETIYKRDYSSRIARGKKNYEILSGVGLDSRGRFLHFSFGKYLDEDTLVEISLNTFSDFTGHGYVSNITEKGLLKVELASKKFFGNSFYTRAGVAYNKGTMKGETQHWSYSFKEGYSETYYEYTLDYSALSIEADIGNQWQWDNFTLGVSWIGFSSHVLNLGKVESTDGMNDINSKSALRLFNIQLGMSF